MITWILSKYHPKQILRIVNTVMAVTLFMLGAYHYTQPDAAWRSGTIETIAALLLLTSAYLVTAFTSVIINLFLALVMVILGIRHAAIGGGWVSGTIELTFAVTLLAASFLVHKNRKIPVG